MSTPPSATPPTFLTRVETARELRISVRGLERRIAEGRVRAVKLGSRVLIPRTELDRLLTNTTD